MTNTSSLQLILRKTSPASGDVTHLLRFYVDRVLKYNQTQQHSTNTSNAPRWHSQPPWCRQCHQPTWCHQLCHQCHQPLQRTLHFFTLPQGDVQKYKITKCLWQLNYGSGKTLKNMHFDERGVEASVLRWLLLRVANFCELRRHHHNIRTLTGEITPKLNSKSWGRWLRKATSKLVASSAKWRITTGNQLL